MLFLPKFWEFTGVAFRKYSIVWHFLRNPRPCCDLCNYVLGGRTRLPKRITAQQRGQCYARRRRSVLSAVKSQCSFFAGQGWIMSLSHPGVATKGKWRSTVIPKLGAPRCGNNDARRAAKKKGMCTLLETYPTSSCESNEGAVVRHTSACVSVQRVPRAVWTQGHIGVGISQGVFPGLCGWWGVLV